MPNWWHCLLLGVAGIGLMAIVDAILDRLIELRRAVQSLRSRDDGTRPENGIASNAPPADGEPAAR